MCKSLGCILLMIAATTRAYGSSHEDPIRLRDGVLDLRDLNDALSRELHLPTCPDSSRVDLSTARGEEFLFAVNACLWDGCRFERTGPTSAALRVEDRPAPAVCDAVRKLARVYAAEKAPHSTAAQARNWGLLLDGIIDRRRPLTVLIHGLDADRSDCIPLGNLLRDAGHQVAYFSYPGEQPIADSAALLRRSLASLRGSYPGIRVDIIAHSMGSLVAREYVEGPGYAGGVDHLIMVAPPNHGSKWAGWRVLLSIEENYHLRRDDPEWRWSWLVTEGLGEAGRDLQPGSPFLKELNNRPRRQGVSYTIIAGSKSGVNRVQSEWLGTASRWIPTAARSWWGVRNCYAGLERKATSLRDRTGSTDGPVSIRSTMLAGVKDVVILPADHVSLYLPVGGRPPAAWAVAKDRLENR